MDSLLHLWRYIRPYRARIALNVLLNGFSAIFAVFSLLMLIPVLKLLFDKTDRAALPPDASAFQGLEGFKAWAESWLNYRLTTLIDAQGEIRALLVVCVVVVVIFLFKNLFRYLALYVVAVIKKGVIRGLHADIYNKLLNFPLSWFDKRKRGDLASRFTADVQEVEYGIIYFLEAFVRDPITIVITLAAMFLISTPLTLIVLITLPVSGLIIGRVGKALKQESRTVQQLMGNLVTRMLETVGGMRVIKSFTAQDYLSSRFERENQAHFEWSTRMLRKRDLSSPLAEFLGIVVVAVLLLLGGRLVFGGRIEPETFITFIVIFSQVISPSKAFANAYYHIQKGLASMERIEELVLDPATDSAAGAPIGGFEREIAFNGVSFAYADRPVLSDVSLTIGKGERVALTGPSGAGKSTLTDLLLGLYSGYSGQITIDGTELNSLDRTDWRRLVSLVPQEPVLFNDTVFENVLFGRPGASRSEVEQALRAAHADEFLHRLPGGIDAIVGENGGNLSGGQRQRIALARALLKNAPILILDEATSALDAGAEAIISETLRELPAATTVIIIAHRSSTIGQCDKIVEIRNGCIASVRQPDLKPLS